MSTRSVDLYRSSDATNHDRIRDRPDLLRVRHGVYADAVAWDRLPPWSRYEHRVRAFTLASPDVVLSHESAAVLLGLPTFGEPRDIHVFADGRASTKRVGDTVYHTSADAREVVDLGGTRTTSMVATAIDLGRVLSPAAGLAVWDAALRAGCDLDELVESWHGQVNSRGTRTLSWLSTFADPLAESPGESVSRAAIHWLGFPAAQLQHPVTLDGESYRGDFWWPNKAIWGEFDGHEKYSLGVGSERISVLAEKRREDTLRRHVTGFARWTFADLTDADRLRAILRAAGLREVTRPDTMRLSTLRSLFRNRRTV